MTIDTLRTALESELAMLNETYRNAIRRGTDLLTDYDRKAKASTHIGHNLANVATSLSELAAKIEQTERVLLTLDAK